MGGGRDRMSDIFISYARSTETQARAISEALRALSFFGDGDLYTLTDAEKLSLVKAAGAIRDLPWAKVADVRLSSLP